MVSFMLYWALQAFIEVAKYPNQDEDVEKYSIIAEKTKKVCEDILWDGEWYIVELRLRESKSGAEIMKRTKFS